ncbi:MAG: tetratricopeptide repeat protein, partial [Planctomycetota bacterium]|nr:tetratricopeptide repeat protein [Planctomycetota bacterium]
MRNTTRPIRIKLQGHTRFLLASMLLVGSGILTASPAAAPAFQGDTEQRDILLRSARNAVSLGDHGRALDRFEELVSRYPDDSEGRREYAGILVLAGKHEAGAQQFLHLLDGDPDNRKLRESLVDAYVLSGDYDRAASNMEHVLERAPDDAPVAARLARLYAWTKNFDRAMEIYRVHLSRLNPTSEDVQRLLAPVLLDTQRPLEALDFLTRLHRRHPNDIEVSADLVKCYTMLGDHVKAADVVDEIEGRDADRIDIRLSLGSYLHNVGSYQASRRIYDQVLSVDSRNREALLGMAQVRLASYELTQALAILQGLGNTSDDRLWKLVMAEYHVIVGEYPDGRALYGDLLAKDEDDFEVRIALGELYQVAGEYDYAMAEYRKVDERSAFGSEARYRHAVALSSLHRFDEANAICRSLLAQDAGYVQPLLLLLTNLGKSGAAEQARMISAEFLKQNRVDTHTVASIREALGRVLLEGGLYSEAAQQYELVVALPAGRTPTAYYGLSLAYRNLDIL